jgi:DNA-binding transcriptional regulator YdaS (Cro superfamily)
MTLGDYRAEIARLPIKRYVLAARIGVHPSRLGQMLNGRVPMPPAVAARISEALQPSERVATVG